VGAQRAVAVPTQNADARREPGLPQLVVQPAPSPPLRASYLIRAAVDMVDRKKFCTLLPTAGAAMAISIQDFIFQPPIRGAPAGALSRNTRRTGYGGSVLGQRVRARNTPSFLFVPCNPLSVTGLEFLGADTAPLPLGKTRAAATVTTQPFIQPAPTEFFSVLRCTHTCSIMDWGY
jgi:hypothetical protein